MTPNEDRYNARDWEAHDNATGDVPVRITCEIEMVVDTISPEAAETEATYWFVQQCPGFRDVFEEFDYTIRTDYA